MAEPASSAWMRRYPPSRILNCEAQDRGSVRCGVADALPGFNFLTPDGDHEGFNSDFCGVIAAAVLGDAGAVDFVDLATSDRFTALQSGEIDVPLRNTTFTANRYGKEAANFVLPRCRCTGQPVAYPAYRCSQNAPMLVNGICWHRGTPPSTARRSRS